jgi:hypothetical protein
MQKNSPMDFLKSPQSKSKSTNVEIGTSLKSLSPQQSPSKKSFFSSIMPSKTSHSNNVSDVSEFNSDFSRKLSLTTQTPDEQPKKHPSPSSSSLASTSSYSANIPNQAKVLQSYTAITEDEISVQKGDTVQIITANLHNRYLVHYESSDTHLAAEGWIPGYVIGITSTSSNGNTNKV